MPLPQPHSRGDLRPQPRLCCPEARLGLWSPLLEKERGSGTPWNPNLKKLAKFSLPLLRLVSTPRRPTEKPPNLGPGRGGADTKPRVEGPSQQVFQSRLLAASVWHREMLLIRGIQSSFPTSPNHLHINLNYSSEVQTLCSPRQDPCSASPDRQEPGSSCIRQRCPYLTPAPASALVSSCPFPPGGQ